jgi:hypothetical protein
VLPVGSEEESAVTDTGTGVDVSEEEPCQRFPPRTQPVARSKIKITNKIVLRVFFIMNLLSTILLLAV